LGQESLLKIVQPTVKNNTIAAMQQSAYADFAAAICNFFACRLSNFSK
jgi:hypothetical protein